jgi:hypothetical protein
LKKLHIPETDESFLKVEKKDWVVHNRKQIGTLDVIKNYERSAHRKVQYMSLSP